MDGALDVLPPRYRVGDRVQVVYPGKGYDGELVIICEVLPFTDADRPAWRELFGGRPFYAFVDKTGMELALPEENFRPASAPADPPGRVRLTILGECASKANSRKLIMVGGHPRFVLSDKARKWSEAARRQVPIRNPLLAGPLVAWVKCYYSTERPDLDPSLVFDVLQGRVYSNDRSIREYHAYHAIDRANPRVEVVIEPMQGALV